MNTTSDPGRPHAAGFNGAVMRQIRAEAAARGISDQQLADRAGLHPTVLSRYLNFKRLPTLEVVDRLADALGIAPDDLARRAWSERREE